MFVWTPRIAALAAALATFFASAPAQAIPAFARKYGTSCETCHTVYPKLTPFGEAFRHNGYRFPGVDSDYWKQETVAMGQEGYKKTFPNSVWPGIAAGGAPLALGFNGTAVIHPDTNATGAQADNGTVFSMRDLVGEAHLWAGGSYDDKITYWGEVTFSSDGTISIEKAQVLVNDIVGPQHAVNAIVGRGVANVSSFGPHSSYVNDTLMPSVPTTALLGNPGDSFNIGDNYNFAEVNGVVGGRAQYNIGLSAGQHFDVRPTENFYGHIGYKLGGMRMDGEGNAGPQDAEHPWAETAVTFDAFAYKSVSHFVPTSVASAAAAAGTAPVPQQDSALTVGGGVRAQWRSLELNSGFYWENHGNAQDPANVLTNGQATMFVQYNELSYVVYPWLVPAVRVEWNTLTPNGGATAYDTRIMPGAAILIRPNLKLVVFGQIEAANASPPGGWGAVNGMAAPTTASVTEFESINFWLASAF